MLRRLTALFLLASAASWAGDIEGKVELKSSLAGHRAGKQKDSDNSPGGAQYNKTPGGQNELANAVVYLEGANLKATPLKKRTSDNEIIQKEKEFRPHVVAVPKGSSVYFDNKDGFKHHVYSESDPGAFELPNFLGTRSETFEQPNQVEVFCGIHTSMNAYVFVAENDYFSKTNASGQYRIRSVPPGTYKVKVWHPRLQKETVQTVTVPASGKVKLDLAI